MISDKQFSDLKKEVLANRISQGVGYKIKRTGVGTTLDIKPSSGSGGLGTHPFQVLQRPHPETEGIWQYGVIYESNLFKSLKPNDMQTISGLLSEDKSTGWFSLVTGGYIWLEISITNAGVITATINNSDEDDFDLTANAWSGILTDPSHTGFCEDNGETTGVYAYKHKTSRKPIAFTESSDGAPIIIQSMKSHQILWHFPIDGRPAKYPLNYEGEYPY